MARRGGLLIGLLAIVVACLPASAAPKGPERGLLVIRQTKSGGSFSLHFRLQPQDGQGFIARAMVHGKPSERFRFSVFTDMHDFSPMTSSYTLTTSESGASGLESPVYYYAYVGRLSELSFKGRGFALQRRPPTFVRMMRDGSVFAGSASFDFSVEPTSYTTKARASVAIGGTPCNGWALPPEAGASVLTLAGGWRDDQQICPEGRQPSEYSRTPTTWTLSGPAAGLVWGPTRLFVLEL